MPRRLHHKVYGSESRFGIQFNGACESMKSRGSPRVNKTIIKVTRPRSRVITVFSWGLDAK